LRYDLEKNLLGSGLDILPFPTLNSYQGKIDVLGLFLEMMLPLGTIAMSSAPSLETQASIEMQQLRKEFLALPARQFLSMLDQTLFRE